MNHPADPHVEALCAFLRQRSAIGVAKYGVTLARTDLTPAQWLQHMREELADAALYCGRLAHEIEGKDAEIAALRAKLGIAPVLVAGQ